VKADQLQKSVTWQDLAELRTRLEYDTREAAASLAALADVVEPAAAPAWDGQRLLETACMLDAQVEQAKKITALLESAAASYRVLSELADVVRPLPASLGARTVRTAAPPRRPAPASPAARSSRPKSSGKSGQRVHPVRRPR